MLLLTTIAILILECVVNGIIFRDSQIHKSTSSGFPFY